MYKIVVINQMCGSKDKGKEYTIDPERKFEGYQEGDLICYIAPFYGIPLTLNIAIRKTGELIFRSWSWNGGGNKYLHTEEVAAGREKSPFQRGFVPTQAQIDTVSGLFSGRITFDGLELPPGKSLQEICHIDVKREEELVGHKIYLA